MASAISQRVVRPSIAAFSIRRCASLSVMPRLSTSSSLARATIFSPRSFSRVLHSSSRTAHSRSPVFAAVRSTSASISAGASPGSTATPLLGIVGILFLFTMAELLLSPVGQSLATKLAPEAFKTQMVALFFLTVSIGSALSGVLAAFYDPADASAERAYFLVLGVASIAVAVVMALLAPWIRKRMVGVR